MSGESVELESTTLARAAYDEHLALLRLEFTSGDRYVYSGVPPQVFLDLLAAPSKGSFFHRSIRGQYAFVKAAG
jgi:hypothetical protein